MFRVSPTLKYQQLLPLMMFLWYLNIVKLSLGMFYINKFRSQCLIDSFFSHNIPLRVPIVSSPMDTVT
jgi:hypothetical protein